MNSDTTSVFPPGPRLGEKRHGIAFGLRLRLAGGAQRAGRWVTDHLHLQHLLFLALICVSAIPALVFAMWTEVSALDQEVATAHDKHLVIARNLAYALERYALDVTAVFRFLSTGDAANSHAAGVPDLLKSLDFRYICIFNGSGKVVHIWAAPGVSPAQLASPQMIQALGGAARTANGKVVMTDFRLVSGIPLMFLTQTLDADRFAVAAIGTAYFSELRKAVTFGKRGHAAIVDRRGHVIAHPNHAWETSLKDLSALTPVAAMMHGKTGVTTFYSPGVNQDVIAGYASVPGAGWGVMVPQPMSELSERADETRLLVFGIAATGLVLAAFISWCLARLLAAPLSAVVVTAGKIAGGQRDERVRPLPRRTPREFRDLADAFNRMVDNLEQSNAQLAQTEEQLRQAQKLEAIGRLTGGIAHDFNNMLTVIGGNLELLEARCARFPEVARIAKAASVGVVRAEKVTRQLLAYARKQALELRALDLNRTVGELIDLAARVVGDRVEIRFLAAPHLGLARSDKNQVESALLNLLVNSRDAIKGQGRITITTADRQIGREDAAALGAEIAPGRYVELAVADTGSGMSAEVRAKAIEPFFTTKNAGKGTGLGLSMVYGFMRQSGGHLLIDSEAGKGTTIRLLFPEVDPAEGKTAEALDDAAHSGLRALRSGRRRTILVVEDDASVRQFAASVLRDLDCEVIEAPNGQAGLEMLQRHEAIEILLTDLVMPGPLSGADLARAALHRQTDVEIVLTTGYSSELNKDEWPPDRVSFLAKPYRASDLVRTLGTALEQAS